MNTVLTYLATNRQRLGLAGYGVPERLASVVVTPRFRASSHVVFLVLAPGRPEPLLVAKLPRLNSAGAVAEREVANLRAVQDLRAGGFDSIPRVIAYEQYLGRPILVETALVGRPMDPATVRRDRAACCAAVAGWLAELQEPARSAENDANWFGRLVEQPLRYFEHMFPLSIEEARLLERTWELVAPLRDTALPLVFEHGDLSHPNVMLLKNGAVGVVDWELAEPRGLPAYDLFFFLTYAAFAAQNARKSGDYLAAFRAAFFGPAAWARPYVADYARRLELRGRTRGGADALHRAGADVHLAQQGRLAQAQGDRAAEVAGRRRAGRRGAAPDARGGRAADSRGAVRRGAVQRQAHLPGDRADPGAAAGGGYVRRDLGEDPRQRTLHPHGSAAAAAARLPTGARRRAHADPQRRASAVRLGARPRRAGGAREPGHGAAQRRRYGVLAAHVARARP